MGDPAIGSTLAGYRIDGLIARGGMGVVYRATHLALDRPVALKVIAHELAEKDDFRERFLRESRLAARLDHPNVVPVFDAREEEGELIVAMRLVEGGDLKRLIRQAGPLPPDRALNLLSQAAAALDAAHAAGIVHRDVKPHNILVEGEHAFLTDFGVAKAFEGTSAGSGASVVGTVEYMSPEQWRGSAVGPPADVYSLGCVLYEALTGIVPYARKESEGEPQMPRGLDEVIEKAVAKDPADRYRSAGALIEAARQRQGATPTATRVLSDDPDRPTVPLFAGRTPAQDRRRRWLEERLDAVPRGVLYAAIALIALAVALASLLDGDGVSVSAPIEVGPGPLRLAAGEGAIWVTSAADGTLSRIDPETAELAGKPIPVGPGVSGVAAGGGSIWVSSPETGEVLRVDPGSGRVTQRIELGGRPGAIAFGGGRVWVADGAGAGVAAIGAARGAVLKQRIVPHAAPLRLAVGAGGLWVSSASTAAIRRIDLGSLDPAPTILVGRGPAGVTVGAGLVWVANSRAATVTRVEPSTHELRGDPIPVGAKPGGIDAGTDAVWVADSEEGTISRLALDSGETIGDPIEVGSRLGAVVVGEEAVWVASNGDGTVTRIEP
jgi:DNA-binding beta-propeller fold protein YncE/predicted Ser/Thr protein kinase